MAVRSDSPRALDTGWLRAQRRPIKVIAASNVAIMVVGCLFLIQYWRMESMMVFWSLVAALAVVALNLVFLHRTRRIKIAGYVSASVLFLTLLVVVARSGGFYDPSFAWLYLVPLAAAFLVDLTALLIFLGLVLGATVVFWSLPLGTLTAAVPAEMYEVHTLLTRIAILMSIGMVTAFFVRAQYRALRLLKRANDALQEEVDAHTKTTEALAESESHLRDLVENSADMIWTHDLRGVISTANEAFSRFLGVARAELVGVPAERFLAPDAVSAWSRYLRTIADEGSFRGLMAMRGADGRSRSLEFHNTLRDDGVGEPMVRALARDVTVQEASREALQRRVDQEQLMVAISTRFIETGGEELSTAIELAMGEIGVFLRCDQLNFFLLASRGQAFEKFAGWSADAEARPNASPEAVELPGLLPRFEQFETIVVPRCEDLSPAARAEFESLLGKEARSATMVPVFGREGLIGLLTLETVESEREWLREHQALAHIAGMVFGNAVTRARDETRALRLQDEIQRARKMESLGLIAGGIAHDFNNLLMVMLGNASLAMSQVAEGSGAQEALQAIDSSARRAAKLTAQMLAFAGGGTLDRAAADLNELVEIELEQVRRNLGSGVELRGALDSELQAVYADPAQIRQMLRALLDNAAEALGEAGGTIEVETRRSMFDPSAPARGYRPIRSGLAAAPCALLEVRDSGPGIGEGSLEKIFDPFYSTKFAGRGLGLAAVLGVVRGHEGLIEVESESGRTRVQVLIPLAKSQAGVRSGAAAAQPAATAPGREPGSAVLVLDTNPEVLGVLDRVLANGGYECIGTDRVPDALEQLAEPERLCAVVSELKTVEDSDSLLAARWRTENIPWILSSDERRRDIAERLAYAGASAFLSKPFEGRKLLSLLDGLLREYRPVGAKH